MVGNATCIFIMRNSTNAQNGGKLSIADYLGVAVWVIGVLIETLADM